MNDKTLSECMSLIEGNYLMCRMERAWIEATQEMFQAVLQFLPDDLGRRAVMQLVTEAEYCVKPGQIGPVVAKLASPLPPEGVLWTEFWHKCIHAEYRRPRWSHPVLEDVAAHMGGWEAHYSNYWPDSPPERVEGLRTRFTWALKSVAEEWGREVIRQLRFAANERDPHYFPEYVPFQAPRSLPAGDPPVRALTAGEMRAAMPPDVAKQFDRLRGVIGESLRIAPKQSEAIGLNREKRRQIEEELAARKTGKVESE